MRAIDLSIKKIIELLYQCDDIELLDLIMQLLQKTVKHMPDA